MEDCLIVSYDYFLPDDAATLCIARRERDRIVVLNFIQGNEAMEIYNKLTRSPTQLKERYNKITEMYDRLISNNERQKGNKKKRKYYRKCGICGERNEQSEMIRTNDSPNGWLCWDCRNTVDPECED